MLKLVPSLLRRVFVSPLLKTIPKYFCAQYTIDPKIEHYGDITIRQHRRLHLNRSVLNQTKDVVYGEVRKTSDDMISLKQKGKCPGVIQTISGRVEDEVDIVLDGKKMRRLSKSDNFPLNQLYVRVAGKQYRCIFYRKDYHSDGFIQKVYLKQYVPGKPNRLLVPIQPTHVTENPYFMRMGEAETKLQDIEIICYNEEYPMKFYVDVSYCSPDRPYRVGDLANLLPPGIIISPKHNMNDRIINIAEEQFLSEQQKEEKIAERALKTKQQSALAKNAQSGTGQAAGGATGDAAKDKAGGTAGTAGGTSTQGKAAGSAAGGKTSSEPAGKKK